MGVHWDCVTQVKTRHLPVESCRGSGLSTYLALSVAQLNDTLESQSVVLAAGVLCLSGIGHTVLPRVPITFAVYLFQWQS